MQPRLWPALALLVALIAPCAARADSWHPGEEDELDEAVADGDVERDDPVSLRLGPVADRARVTGHGWLSVVGFTRQLTSGQNDVGGMVMLGLPLDRMAAGSSHSLADPLRPPAQPTASSGPPPPPPPPPPRPAQASPLLARKCVVAALRASGLGVDDSRIDDLVARARASAWLPETRARALRLVTDAARATTLATTDGTNYYSAVGAHLVLELRLTWRLDRLLYAGDEPALERLRLERQDARARLSRRTLDVLFAWQRAVVDLQAALPGSSDEIEARTRVLEAQATLDVLTDGWFSRREDD